MSNKGKKYVISPTDYYENLFTKVDTKNPHFAINFKNANIDFMVLESSDIDDEAISESKSRLIGKWSGFVTKNKQAIIYLSKMENARIFASSLTAEDLKVAFKENYYNTLMGIPGLSSFLNKNIDIDDPLMIYSYLKLEDVINLWTSKNDSENYLQPTDIEKVVVQKKVKYSVTTTDKISQKTFDNEIVEAKYAAVNMAPKGKKAVETLVSINFDNTGTDIQYLSSISLDEFDRLVHNAVLSLMLAGNHYITHTMVYSAMTGKQSDKIHLSKLQNEAIEKSMYKLRRLYVKIDATAEANSYGLDSFIYEDTMLSFVKVTASLNGNVLEVYKLLELPPLYKYASGKKQIDQEDIKVLDTPINKNKNTLMLQSILYHRVIALKSAKSSMSPVIKYDYLLDRLGIKAEDMSPTAFRKKKVEIRNYTTKILDYWVECGMLDGYQENKDGRTFTGITVYLSRNQKQLS